MFFFYSKANEFFFMNRFSGGLLRSPTNMNPWNFIDTFHVALWTISSGTVLILKCPFRYKGNKDSRGYFYKLSLFTQRINNQTISNWEISLLGLEDVRGNKWIFFKSSLKPVSKTEQSLFFFFFLEEGCLLQVKWSLWLQFSSVAQSCLTLCDPMDHRMPGL